MNNVPKISVEIDGKIYDADNVDSFLLIYENGLWRIQITTDNLKNDNSLIHQPVEDVPEMTQPILDSGQYHALHKDELSKLKKQSKLRRSKKSKNSPKETEVVTLESSIYDIVTDVDGFSQAIEEIAKKETTLADQGWIFDGDVEDPICTFVADGSDDSKEGQKFKIRTKVSIIR